MITGLLETTGLTGTHTHTHTHLSVGASSRPGNDGYFSFSTPDVHIDWQPHTEADNLSSPLLPCRLVWERGRQEVGRILSCRVSAERHSHSPLGSSHVDEQVHMHTDIYTNTPAQRKSCMLSNRGKEQKRRWRRGTNMSQRKQSDK